MTNTFSPEAIMAGMNGDVLKKLAHTLGTGKGLTRKLDVAQAVGLRLRAHLPEALELCSALERKALAEAAHDPGFQVDQIVFFDIASHATIRAICQRAGETHLVVGERNAKAFRSALKKLGHILPP